MSDQAKPKLKIGQVVRLIPYEHCFGTITKLLPGSEAEVSFYDLDGGYVWSWMYSLAGLVPLTKKQKGI